MKVDEFRDALKDEEVEHLFADMFDRRIDANLSEELSDEFAKKVDELTVTIAALRIGVQRKDALIGSLRNENDVLKKFIKHLNEKVDAAYQRREYLIFTGLPKVYISFYFFSTYHC